MTEETDDNIRATAPLMGGISMMHVDDIDNVEIAWRKYAKIHNRDGEFMYMKSHSFDDREYLLAIAEHANMRNP